MSLRLIETEKKKEKHPEFNIDWSWGDEKEKPSLINALRVLHPEFNLKKEKVEALGEIFFHDNINAETFGSSISAKTYHEIEIEYYLDEEKREIKVKIVLKVGLASFAGITTIRADIVQEQPMAQLKDDTVFYLEPTYKMNSAGEIWIDNSTNSVTFSTENPCGEIKLDS